MIEDSLVIYRISKQKEEYFILMLVTYQKMKAEQYLRDIMQL